MRMTRGAMGRRVGAGVRSQRKSCGDDGTAMHARQGRTQRQRSARLRVVSDDSRSGRYGCRPSGSLAVAGERERA